MGKSSLAIIEAADTEVMARGAENDNEKGANLVWAEAGQIEFMERLIENGEINDEQAKAAMWEATISQDKLGNILVKHGVLRHDRLMSLMEDFDKAQIATSLQYNVPVDDTGFLHEQKVVLFGMSERSVYLACAGNERLVRAHFMEQFPDKDLQFLAVELSMIQHFLERSDKLPRKTEMKTGDDRLHITKYVPKGTSDSDVLDLLVNLCGIRGGSDIHIEPKAQSYTVLMRINRIRRIVHEGSLQQYGALRAQIKDRARMDQMEFRRPQDGAYSQEILGRIFDLRVATFPLQGGQEKIVMRLLDPDKASMSLGALGLTNVDKFREACAYPHGFVLVVGKTNSGKSTTLISSLREQDRIGKAIYTIEDPIEHRLDFITQMAVNKSEAVGLDFTTATRAMMRGDPEIILVGEIRDIETARTAIRAAESGHLVMSTLHAGTVRETVNRLRGFGVEKEELRSLLRGILAQRLMRTLCDFCRGAKCPSCMHTGYGGMTVISEMGFFESDKAFDRMLAGEHNWQPMVQDALNKLDRGITDENEIYRVFRSEIEYLPDNFEGARELADRVLRVVKRQEESSVDRTPLRQRSAEDRAREEEANLHENQLSKLALNGISSVPRTDLPSDEDYGA